MPTDLLGSVQGEFWGSMRHTVVHGPFTGHEHLAMLFAKTFLTSGYVQSFGSLFSALVIAGGFLVLRRSQRNNFKIRVLWRALFARRLFTSASSRADLGFLFLNMVLAGALVAWGVVSGATVSNVVRHVLTNFMGEPTPNQLDPGLCQIVATVVLFVTYDFAYWVDHYVSHRIGWLWEFHKVHHTAEVLTPLTNSRVHPVDSLVFLNFLSVFLGIANGVLAYWFGKLATPFTIGGTNVLAIVFAYTFLHLQHSHIWIATTGRIGRIIFSPAHHQIHHSAASIHFDKNFGSCFALWDWMFGTLYVPTSQRERLTYGVAPDGVNPHTAMGALLMPFVHSASRILPTLQPSKRSLPSGGLDRNFSGDRA
jgi:sterol desaturase/sphingolipid hydroxylase (fatty acid hydroxylase superfamily)